MALYIAQDLPGVLGARLTGAGFGGATVTLCERASRAANCCRILKALRRRHWNCATRFRFPDCGWRQVGKSAADGSDALIRDPF
jgi:galactokinase